jgi:hypothetical protein
MPKYHQFQAAWMSTEAIPELHAETGLWELECISPDRRGAWAAFWMTGVQNGNSVWPPEIDIFEHFNGAYGGVWNAKRETSAALHYGEFGQSRIGAKGGTIDLGTAGFPATTDLTAEAHKHQCLITKDFITIFFDGLEIVQFRHILKPVKASDTKLFYPMFNVAVAPGKVSEPYDKGSGDMLVYGLRYWPLDRVRVG